MRLPRAIRSLSTRLALAGAGAAIWIWAIMIVQAPGSPNPDSEPSHHARAAGSSDRAGGSRDPRVLPERGAPAPSRRHPTSAAAPELDAEPDAELAPDDTLGELRGALDLPDGEVTRPTMLIALDTDNGSQHRTVADLDGNFAFGPLAPGTYEVWASTLGAARLGALRQPEVVETITLEAGDTTWIELSPPESDDSEPPLVDEGPTSTVRGTIVSEATGEPLEGVAIVLSPTGTARWARSPRAVTDASGAFEIDGVPTGSVRLLVLPARTEDGQTEYRTAPREIDVPDLGPTELAPLALASLTLPPAR